MKILLMSAPILTYPSYMPISTEGSAYPKGDGSFILRISASNEGMGTVPITRKERAIAFARHSLINPRATIALHIQIC